MANSKLQGKYYKLPEHLTQHFSTVLTNYEKSGGKKTEQGYQRLSHFIDNKKISYENLKKIKNFFDKFENINAAIQQGSETEFKLTGGSKFKNWINDVLNNERTNVEKTAEVNKDMQIEKVKITLSQLNYLIENAKTKDGKTLAAGVYPIAKSTGRILLQQRGETINNPLEWTNWGGKADEGENAQQNALREFKEESGYEGDIIKIIPSFVYEGHDVIFSNFIAIVPNEFVPPMVGKETVDGVVEVSNHRWETLEGLLEFEGKFHKGVHSFIENEYNNLYNIIAKL